MTVTLDWTDR